jgi:tRNA-specific 2-thiouridylase
LLNKALALGADFLATGHYCRTIYDEASGQHRLLKAVDANKDQSYVLYMLGQQQLSRIKFPLGDYTKVQVREMAAQYGLVTANKPESQDICFVAGGDYRDFLVKKQGEEVATPGPIVNLAGQVVGEHQGLSFYTIGQRKGLGIATPKPTYVLKVIPSTNTLVVGDDADLRQREFEAEDVSFVSGDWPHEPLRVTVKVRYKAQEMAGTIEMVDHTEGLVKITLDQPQRAITPGQAAVFYVGDEVIGGGVIRNP